MRLTIGCRTVPGGCPENQLQMIVSDIIHGEVMVGSGVGEDHRWSCIATGRNQRNACIMGERADRASFRFSVGEWLSLVEHLVRDQGVGGSNPLSPTNSCQLLTARHASRIKCRLGGNAHVIDLGLLFVRALNCSRCCRGHASKLHLQTNFCRELLSYSSSSTRGSISARRMRT